jgi:hypothetical protein
VGSFREPDPSFPMVFSSLAASFDHVSERGAEHSPVERKGLVGSDDDETRSVQDVTGAALSGSG